MRVKFQRYKPDNSMYSAGYAGGFGGFLMSRRVEMVMRVLASQVKAAVALSAAAAEPEAVESGVEPGHVVKTYSKIRTEAFTDRYKLSTGRVNSRRAVSLSVTGTYAPGDRGEDGYAINLRSDPIVLEAGSRRGYNEGAKSDRPALRVMNKALRTWSAAHPGTRVVTPRSASFLGGG